MRRLLTVSALCAVAVFATAGGQLPGSPTDPLTKPGDKKVEKKADPTDAVIAAALANDPDVRMAKAKIQLAEAELAKARRAVTLKVLTLKATIEQQKAAVAQTEERVAWAVKMVEKGNMTQAQLLAEREKLEAAKAALAQAEAEWKLLTGGAAGAATDLGNAEAVARALEWFQSRMADGQPLEQSLLAGHARPLSKGPTGPIPDRIRAALDKPVRLGPKGEKVPVVSALDTLQQAAGLHVPVRCSPEIDELGKIVSEREEMPLGAWLQLIEDGAVITVQMGTGKDGSRTAKKRFRFYVREYGLLFTATDAAPPDAPTLTEFWKQKPPEKK